MYLYRGKTSCSGSAFTLIELLIVVAIIAILAAIAVPNFLEAQTRAKVSRARADMRTEATALETYRIDYNRFPRPVEAFVDTPNWYHFAAPEWHEHMPSIMTTPVAYLSSLPLDPFKPKVASHREWLKPFEGRHYYSSTEYLLKRLPTYWLYLLQRQLAGEYVFFSYGPDQSYYNEPPGGTPKTEGQYIDYDATNGTVSRGNIIRSHKNGDVFGVEARLKY